MRCFHSHLSVPTYIVAVVAFAHTVLAAQKTDWGHREASIASAHAGLDPPESSARQRPAEHKHRRNVMIEAQTHSDGSITYANHIDLTDRAVHHGKQHDLMHHRSVDLHDSENVEVMEVDPTGNVELIQRPADFEDQGRGLMRTASMHPSFDSESLDMAIATNEQAEMPIQSEARKSDESTSGKSESTMDSGKSESTMDKDCVWDLWQDWLDCTVSCGGGDMLRTRLIARRAAEDGDECEGPSQQTNSCNLDECSSGDHTKAAELFKKDSAGEDTPRHADRAKHDHKKSSAEVQKAATKATAGAPVEDHEPEIGRKGKADGEDAKWQESKEFREDVKIGLCLVGILGLSICVELLCCGHLRRRCRKKGKKGNCHAGPFNDQPDFSVR